MTSLFDLHADSSDSEDDLDYLPPPPAADDFTSDEEDPLQSSDDEKETKRTAKKVRVPKERDIEHKPKTEGAKPSSPADEKKKANDVYKIFLEEVAAEMNKEKGESEPSGGIFSCSESTASSPVASLKSEESDGINSRTDQSSSVNTPEKQCNATLFEFAGETISVNESDVTGNVCVKPSESSTTSIPPSGKRKGLASVLGTILNKKQKITTLEKTLIDWQSFKKEEGIEKDLEKYNRGKGGFIERKRFLERSDIRSYEIERDMRLASRAKK